MINICIIANIKNWCNSSEKLLPDYSIYDMIKEPNKSESFQRYACVFISVKAQAHFHVCLWIT